MGERPILFSAPMVRAILAGTKTQTRRVVAPSNSEIGSLPQKAWGDLDFSKAWVDPGGTIFGPGPYLKAPKPIDDTVHRVYPRYQVGDRLWGKETWAPADWMAVGGSAEPPQFVAYRADKTARGWNGALQPFEADTSGWNWDKFDRGWRPSIFMPRWVSRLNLEIVELRAQRVQDISEDDARAEGVESGYAWDDGEEHLYSPDGVDRGAGCGYMPPRSHVQGFFNLWDEINGDRPGCSVEANPWVWAITFKRINSASEAA